MPITLNKFLSIIINIREAEAISDEKYLIVESNQCVDSQCEKVFSEWVFSELNVFNAYKKAFKKLKKNLKSNYQPNRRVLSFPSFEKMTNWLVFIGYGDEWDVIEDEVFCKLFEDISYKYNERLTQFYETKLNYLSINKSSINKYLYAKIPLIDKTDKLVFTEFPQNLNESHPINIQDLNSSIQSINHIQSPFSEGLLDFYLFLENKFGTNNKSDFSAYWKCLSDNELISIKTEKKVKQRFIDWINLRFNFEESEKITTLQTNLSEDFLDGLDEELFLYEQNLQKENKAKLHRFDDTFYKRLKK